MKRNLIIATVTAAALVTGGTAAAFAAADEAPSQPPHAVAQSDDRDDAADASSDAEEARDAVRGTEVTAAEALRAVAGHGTVISLELDDDGTKAWDVELLTKDGAVQDWTVDAKTAKAAKAVQDKEQDTGTDADAGSDED
ncbi:PepSY domain-containing protein [Streptomyces sp. NPDC093595]|uniref:PepSY domain-containing protein n=1 Tax=Streptomyces sp. NPDC093595 TaxID=3366045 RepID=UPI003819F0DD